MEKRKAQRKPANFYVSIFHDKTLCRGVIMNLSESGMYIQTQECLPVESEFSIHIPLDMFVSSKETDIILAAKVVRLVKADDIHHGMGIEVLVPQSNYTELVENHRVHSEMLKIA